MNFLIILAAVFHLVHCGIIDNDHERPTSYQNIHIEHFHPVPTFIRKEYKHLLEHPVSLGSSSSKVEVHHGDKHDHGYAFASADNNIHGHGLGDFNGLIGGHEGVASAGYQVQDQGEEYEGHLGQAGAGLAQFQLDPEYPIEYGKHE